MPSKETQSPALLTVEEATGVLRCSRTKLFGLIRERELRRIIVGRTALIPLDDVTRYLSRLIEAA